MIALMYIYHLIWTCLIILSLPLIFFTKRRRMLDRLGIRLPAVPPKGGSIWIHALSVGEVLSAIPLVKAVGLEYPEKDIVFTVTTDQGKEIARKELQGKVRVLLTMPLDFWWSMARVVNFISPVLFVLVETDIWPGLIGYLKKRGTKSVVINGRISPRTFRSYRRFRFFVRRMLNAVDSWMMQSDLDRDRLLQIGIGEEKVKTVGNPDYSIRRVQYPVTLAQAPFAEIPILCCGDIVNTHAIHQYYKWIAPVASRVNTS